MIDELANALETSDLAEGTKLRLACALPYLNEALGNMAELPSAGLLIGAATPWSCVVVFAHAWPVVDEAEAGTMRTAEVALSVAKSIESTPTTEVTDRLVFGLAVLLGASGRAACAADAARITAAGGVPLVVALLDHVEADKTVSMIITTIAVKPHTRH